MSVRWRSTLSTSVFANIALILAPTLRTPQESTIVGVDAHRILYEDDPVIHCIAPTPMDPGTAELTRMQDIIHQIASVAAQRVAG